MVKEINLGKTGTREQIRVAPDVHRGLKHYVAEHGGTMGEAIDALWRSRKNPEAPILTTGSPLSPEQVRAIGRYLTNPKDIVDKLQGQALLIRLEEYSDENFSK